MKKRRKRMHLSLYLPKSAVISSHQMSVALQSEGFNPVEEPDSFDGMYACDR